MGTKALIEYVYVSKRACNCRIWEFWAVLYGKVGVSCQRHPYIESVQTLWYIHVHMCSMQYTIVGMLVCTISDSNSNDLLTAFKDRYYISLTDTLWIHILNPSIIAAVVFLYLLRPSICVNILLQWHTENWPNRWFVVLILLFHLKQTTTKSAQILSLVLHEMAPFRLVHDPLTSRPPVKLPYLLEPFSIYTFAFQISSKRRGSGTQE